MLRYLVLLILCCFSTALLAQTHQQPGKGNPIIPGYFADPTVKKFGDTYYIYATTDGNGGGFGPSQVWMSKDFVNWSLQDMNWPTTHHYWAPDVTQGNDGKYYIYYCQPVEIFGAVGDTPVGPWTSLLPEGKPIVPNFLVPNVITLDGQTFRDDDGKFYMYWGTWGIYPNHGCGVGLMNADMKSFAQLAQIPNTVAKDFFEAPFMFKRNGIYYLTYSSGRCEDGTYRVQYVMSKTGPMGPFVFGKNNPVLSTNADGTVHGPGHQSVLQQGADFYMIYHRHNNPNNEGGYHRQVVADKMEFDSEGNIVKINPTHEGVGYLAKNSNPFPNLAFNAKVKASSFYGEDFKPGFAVDDHNGTLWKPKNNTVSSWLELDLGTVKRVKSIHTQFEYATWYYQYRIDYSVDGKIWKVYADKTQNTKHGSPVIDFGDVKARYLKLTITDTEYPGLNKAVWNIKVFDNDAYRPNAITTTKKLADHRTYTPQGLIVDLNAKSLKVGSSVSEWLNAGKVKGVFSTDQTEAPVVDIIGGKKALVFPGKSYFKSSFKAPGSLSGNSSFTAAMWVYNPTIGDEEPILSWTQRGGVDLTNATVGYGRNRNWGAVAHMGWPDMPYKKLPEAGKWHHIALVFDGTMERLYVDGVLDTEERKMLFINRLSEIYIGTTPDRNAYFSGAIASVKLYDTPLSANEVKKLATENNDSEAALYFESTSLDYGKLKAWKNEGFAGGNLVPAENPLIVEDMESKVALNLGNGGKVTFDKASPSAEKPFTIVAQVFASSAKQDLTFSMGAKRLKIKGTGKWEHVVSTFDGRLHQTYINGIIDKQNIVNVEKISRNGFNIFTNNEGAESSKNGIASLILYNYALSHNAALAQYESWQQHKLASSVVAEFEQQPIAISPTMITMSAKIAKMPGKGVKYYFTTNDGLFNSGWINDKKFTNFGLIEEKTYQYTVKARDNFGNVTLPAVYVNVNTAKNQFKIFNNGFSTNIDFKNGVSSTGWDGLMGNADQAAVAEGVLTLSSTNTKWDRSTPLGPFLYKTISGNFVAEVNLTDMSGLKERKANGASDVGLMVRNAENGGLLQNSVMLGWGIGNMVTNFGSRGRIQTNNNTAFNFHRYLQIERDGNIFYLRSSEDGKSWKELPGSPVLRTDMDKKPLQIGLYHATYGEQSGYGSFSNFRIDQRKTSLRGTKQSHD
ncbi:family 43 glycosylhydrolase [Pedobacter insulae]|uniref:F5/8 type C domain-containing protein n=1 Tax=Pedobacter insulae TaxID=414048 RepID=A0A1I2V0X5_9SPHI|nr:family 43 glycosylhydrolase [Pedobacter insulae]SFG82892.1 F5/8 type C domain-containing protein [Pedobacter insulae]